MSPAGHSVCQACGATVYPEHIDSGIARYEGGKLMCSHCVEEYERVHDRSTAKGGTYGYAPIAMDESKPAAPRKDEHRDSSGSSFAYNVGQLGAAAGWSESRYARPLNPAGANATRCRTFHCKLNDAAAEFMNNAINQWTDANPDITIKFATSAIGVFEGKSAAQNLIVTVFY
ncbi:MAG: hypothetical protein C4547_03275 [Phycisphaerales bacterium]|nr:MAG: hypothetical protein C4547_03275 [Phycisphaerales bacterium]